MMAPPRSLRVRTVLRRMALERLASFRTCRPQTRKSHLYPKREKKNSIEHIDKVNELDVVTMRSVNVSLKSTPEKFQMKIFKS